MRKVLFFLFSAGLFSAQNVEFTDVNFKNAIIKAYPNVDANKDNEISLEEAKTLTSIRNLSGFPKITNAKGIEAFVNLTELDLGQKDLTTIDVSANVKLTNLNIRENKLAGTLDLTNLSTLKNLELNKNSLTSLVLPQNGMIEILYCNENKLTTIDVSKLPNLKRLFLVKNEITTLNLSQNLLLERLHIDNNKIVNLNLTNLTKLNWMSVNNNLLTQITFHNNPLLKSIIAQNNTIAELNFQDGFTNVITLINLTGNTDYKKIIKDCSDTLPSVTVTVEDNCTTLGVDSLPSKTLQIYPNPVQENIYFSENIFVESYQIFNMEGKLVITGKSNNEIKLIPVQALKSGNYILKLKTKKGNTVHRFMKI